jgi:hypothetical protein
MEKGKAGGTGISAFLANAPAATATPRRMCPSIFFIGLLGICAGPWRNLGGTGVRRRGRGEEEGGLAGVRAYGQPGRGAKSVAPRSR